MSSLPLFLKLKTFCDKCLCSAGFARLCNVCDKLVWLLNIKKNKVEIPLPQPINNNEVPVLNLANRNPPIIHRNPSFVIPRNITEDLKESFKVFSLKYGSVDFKTFDSLDQVVVEKFLSHCYPTASLSFDGSDLVIFPTVYIPSWCYKNVQTIDAEVFFLKNYDKKFFFFGDIFGPDSKYVKCFSFKNFAIYRLRQAFDPVYYLDVFSFSFLNKIASELISSKNLKSGGTRFLSSLIRSNMVYYSYDLEWYNIFMKRSQFIIDYAQRIVEADGVSSDLNIIEFAESIGVTKVVEEEQPKRSPYPLFLFIVGSTLILSACGISGLISIPYSVLTTQGVLPSGVLVMVGVMLKQLVLTKSDPISFSMPIDFSSYESLSVNSSYMCTRCQTRKTPLRDGCSITEFVEPIRSIEARLTYRVLPFIKTYYVYHVNSTWNALTSNTERQMKLFPREVALDTQQDFISFCQELFLPLTKDIMSHQKYLDTRNWPYSKKFTFNTYLTSRPDCSMLDVPKLHKNFVKTREFILDDPSKPPRNINAANEMCIFVMGPVFASIYKTFGRYYNGEHKTFGTYQEFFWSSGKNLNQIGDWCTSCEDYVRGESGEELYYIGIDYSKYDATQTPWMFSMLGEIYLRLVLDKAQHPNLIEYTKRFVKPWRSLHMNYKDGGKILFTISGSRPTGDPDTTVGNTLLNQLFLSYSFLKLNLPFGCAIHGDDSFLIIQKRHRHEFLSSVETLKSLGMDYTLEHSDIRSKVEYNNKIFLNVDIWTGFKYENKILLCNKIGRALSKTPLEWRKVEDKNSFYDSVLNKTRALTVDLAPYTPISRYFCRYFHSIYKIKQNYKQHLDPHKQSLGISHNSVRTSYRTISDLSARYNLVSHEVESFLNSFNNRSLSIHVIDSYVAQKIHDTDIKQFTEEEINVYKTMQLQLGDLS